MHRHINRRSLLTCLTAMGGLGLSPMVLKGHVAGANPIHKIGSSDIFTLSDGHLSLPLNFTFPNAPKDELNTLLQTSGQGQEMLKPDCNITVLRNEKQLIVFDVGAGANFMPTAGKLQDSLSSAGIDPADVSDVVFTHAHPDHIWGLLDDFDELVFPQANYHIHDKEWEYWRKDDTLAKTPEARKSFVVGARTRFQHLEDRISLFQWGDEVVSGVEAVDTSGHTPGHTSFAIHNDNKSLMIVGDALTNIAISFARPEWPSASDQDTQKGIETRLALLDRMTSEKMAMIGYHMPHPGVGYVERATMAYRFVAA